MAHGAASVNLAIRGPLNNFSSAIVAGGASQKLLDASPNWNYIFIQNPSTASESLFLNFTDPATLTSVSMELMPGQFLNFRTPGFITTQQINITAATLGHQFTCFAS